MQKEYAIATIPGLVLGVSARSDGPMSKVVAVRSGTATAEEVDDNRSRFLVKAGVPVGMPVLMLNHVAPVGQELSLLVDLEELGPDHWENRIQVYASGTVARTPNLFGAIVVGDCSPVCLYDRVTHVCSVVHIGHREARDRVICDVIELLKSKYGCDPQNMLAAITPCLTGPGAVYEERRADLQGEAWDLFVEKVKGGWAVYLEPNIRHQLREAGLVDQAIQWIGPSTGDPDSPQYSHYRSVHDGALQGRHMVVFGHLN